MINLVIVNDFLKIQGGTSRVVNNIITNLSSSSDIERIYLVHGSNNIENDTIIYPENVEIISTNQEEIIEQKNLAKGLLQGIWNKKMQKALNDYFKEFDKSNTIIFIHGYMKILSPSVIDVFSSLGFQCVVMVHDYFISCPNGAYYNFQLQNTCELKPLSPACLVANCDSRNYFHKIFRVVRGMVQKFSLNKNSNLLHYIFVSEMLHDKITPYLKSENKFILENPPNNEPNKIDDISKNNYFLYVGRFSPEKGYDLFINWAKMLPDVNFVMVGNQDLELTGIPDNIEILGWLGQKELTKVYDNARCVIIPSKWDEPFGLVAVEAASKGIPLLISKNIGAISYVADAKSGYHIDIDNSADVIKKISLLNNDNSLIKHFSENIFKMYQKKYSNLHSYYNSLLNIFKQVLKNK